MGRLELDTGLGRLTVVGWQDELLRAAAELALAAVRAGERGLTRVDFRGREAWFKRSPLTGRSSWRWGLRRLLSGSPPPRVREYANLVWMNERLIPAPLPLAAGSLVRCGLPRFQFLLTEHLPGAVPLDVHLSGASAAERRALLDELAQTVARLHALRFVHRDLYLRNALALPAGGVARVALLDAWAGGPPPQLRDAAHDLACLLLRAPELPTPPEAERLLELYASERAAQGRPVDARRMLARARARRRRLIARLERRPHERRGLPLPPLEF